MGALTINDLYRLKGGTMTNFNIGDTAYVICIIKNLVGEQIWAYEIVEIKDIKREVDDIAYETDDGIFTENELFATYDEMKAKLIKYKPNIIEEWGDDNDTK